LRGAAELRGGRSLNSYKIKTEKLELKITIVDVSRIHLHEETIPETVRTLADDILKSKVLRHPVIVDEKTLVVLDGMHRVAALQMAGCLRIPVCLVDYDDPSITVETWYRAFHRKTEGGLLKELTKLNIQTDQADIEKARIELGNRSARAFIATKEKCLIVRGEGQDLKEDYQLVARMERVAEGLGYEVSYETERDALRELDEEENVVVIAPPPIRKSDVREYGARDELLPHKATRHIIPARPLGIDVPVEILRSQHLDLSEANRQLIERLKKRALQKFEPGSVIENRRYEEQVFLFK